MPASSMSITHQHCAVITWLKFLIKTCVNSQNVQRNCGNFRGVYLPIESDGDWSYGNGVTEGMNSKQELGWK